MIIIIKNLNKANVGETVYVKKITGNGQVSNRLMEIGLTKGVKVFIKNMAPFGDPMEIEFRGCCLSLGKNEAKNVLITSNFNH